ncbi:hypothetical protein BD413DRAFT_571560 [Trametes elegans]|nr:hypothetical protein BD413DRAFT_571560 [Trametes elegans]
MMLMIPGVGAPEGNRPNPRTGRTHHRLAASARAPRGSEMRGQRWVHRDTQARICMGAGAVEAVRGALGRRGGR